MWGINKALLKIYIQNFKQLCNKRTKFAEIIKFIFFIEYSLNEENKLYG